MTDYSQWPNISSDPTFQNLDSEGQEAIRNKFYDAHVAPQIPKGVDDSTWREGFIQKSLEKDADSGIIGTQDAYNRLNKYGVKPSDSFVSGGFNLKDASDFTQSAGEGIKKGGANIVSGLIKTGADIDSAIGWTSPEDKDKLYSTLNQATAKVNEEKSVNSSIEAGAKFGTEALPFIATAPETIPVKSGNLLLDAGAQGLQLAPSAGATAYATSNAPTEEGRINEGENTAIVTPVASVALGAGAKISNMAVNGSRYLKDLFSLGGNERTQLANVIKEANRNPETGVKGGVTKPEVQNFIDKGKDLQANAKGVNIPTTAMLAGKNVASGVEPTVASVLNQKEEQAATEFTQNLKSNTAPTSAQMQEAQGGVGNIETEGNKELQQGQRHIEGQATPQESAERAISTLRGATKSMQQVNEDAYQTFNKQAVGIEVDPEDVSNAVEAASNTDRASKPAISNFDVVNQHLGLKWDKETGEFDIESSPSLADVSNAIKEIKNKLDNGIVKGDLTVSEKNALQRYQARLTEIRDDYTDKYKLTNPDSIYKESTIPFTQESQAVKAAPAPGKVQPSVNPVNSDFIQNAFGAWKSARNSNKAFTDTEALDTFIKSPENLGSYLKVNPNGAPDVAAYISSKMGEEALKTGELVPEAASKYLGSLKTTIEALPKQQQAALEAVNSVFNGLKATGQSVKDVEPFMNWATGRESNAVFDGALKSEAGFNDLWDKVGAKLQPSEQESLKTVLQNRFIEAHSDSKIEKQLFGANQGQNININTLNPKVINDIVTKNDAKGSIYPVFTKIYGSKANIVEKDLDNLSNFVYNVPNTRPIQGTNEEELAGEVPKGIAYASGIRYGQIGVGQKVIKFLRRTAINQAQIKVLGDLDYAVKLAEGFKARDNNALYNTINESLPKGLLPATVDNKEEPNAKNTPIPAKPSNSVILPGPSEPMAEVYREPQKKSDSVWNAVDLPKGTPSAFDALNIKAKPPVNNTNEPDTLEGFPNNDSDKHLEQINNSIPKPKQDAVKDMESFGKHDTIARTMSPEIEGGYVNNPHDIGGPTNMGITLSTLKQVNPDATVDDLKHLSKEDATNIYGKVFWDKYKIDELPIDAQDVAFDTFVQHNPNTATTLLQKAVNKVGNVKVPVDGKLGQDTIDALKTTQGAALRKAILAVRKDYYVSHAKQVPSQKRFLNGWLNRLDNLA